MKTKQIIMGIIIGTLAFPAVTLGGTFMTSLISGKSIEEAVQILSNQFDVLIGRVENLESKQIEIEGKQTDIVVEQDKKSLEIDTIINEQKQIIIDQQAIIEQLKNEQVKQQVMIDNEKFCREADRLYNYIPPQPNPIPDGWYRVYDSDRSIVGIYNEEITRDPNNPDLKIITPTYNAYLEARAKCK